MRMKYGVGPTSRLAVTVTMVDSPGDRVVGLAAAVVVMTSCRFGSCDGGFGLGGGTCADAVPARAAVMPRQRLTMPKDARVRLRLCPVRKRGLSNGVSFFEVGWEVVPGAAVATLLELLRVLSGPSDRHGQCL